MEDRTEHLEQVLLANVRQHAALLQSLLDRVNHWNIYSRLVYKFYSGSFKVYYLQETTEQIITALTAIAPEGRAFHPIFAEIVRFGTGRKFTIEDNEHWMERTAPIVQAFLHARFFLEMAIKCVASTDPRRSVQSGWQPLAELYRIY